MRKVLIANRGEIALRVVRACHEEGLAAVAVYADPDRTAPHVRAADEAVRLGPAPAPESYLHIDRLLDAARRTGADAVHPGYGFLAERAVFAEAVHDAGLTFIGPSPDAIRAMGAKTEARRRMEEAGVPVVPGTVDPVDTVEDAVRMARDLGYPVLVKAVAGGGGKGMRVARDEQELVNGFRLAVSEAGKAFGHDAVYLERYLARPRHVEIQILADRHGRTMHVGERECSIQRRHQKMIEESPSPAVDEALRERMGAAAVAAATAVGYEGAGTVEFLLDADGSFHFLEMNTRIQVEHPVTEEVFRVDLVREQLRIAAGESMRVPAPLQPRGHAIECRITSEDPWNGFLPATGRVTDVRIPGGPGVRWDAGFATGDAIGLHYDPLLAKLIVWGEERPAAIARMRRALGELTIAGLPTSQPFHGRVMRDPGFVRGDYSIRYLEERIDELLARPVPDDLIETAAVTAALLADQRRRHAMPHPRPFDGAEGQSPWERAARWESRR